MTKFLIIFFCFAIMFACAQDKEINIEKNPNKIINKTSIDETNIDKSINSFTFELYNKLKTNDTNVIFSPYSIYTALCMVYAGAKNNTAKQLETLLKINLQNNINKDDINSQIKKLANLAKKNITKELTLDIANSLWLQKNYKIKKTYIEILTQYYDGSIFNVDFIKNTQNTLNKINKWVGKKTNDNITNLIGPSDVSKLTTLILINAIYFKGNWQNQFNDKLTRKEKFHITKDKSINTLMMNLSSKKFNYMQDQFFSAIELGYSNKNFSMLILLPNEIDGLQKLENSLNTSLLNDIFSKFSKTKINISIPKLNLTSKFNLSDILVELGLKDAFSAKADFSGISKSNDIKISDVIHEANIIVNEKGSVASAATAVMMNRSMSREKPLKFCASHPFIFLIYDKNTKTIFFLGKILNPNN